MALGRVKPTQPDAAIALTRVALLTHWASDVLAGLAIGAAVERLLRLWTGYGSSGADIETS